MRCFLLPIPSTHGPVLGTGCLFAPIAPSLPWSYSRRCDEGASGHRLTHLPHHRHSIPPSYSKHAPELCAHSRYFICCWSQRYRAFAVSGPCSALFGRSRRCKLILCRGRRVGTRKSSRDCKNWETWKGG